MGFVIIIKFVTIYVIPAEKRTSPTWFLALEAVLFRHTLFWLFHETKTTPNQIQESTPQKEQTLMNRRVEMFEVTYSRHNRRTRLID